jgi:hypothetical protein
MTVGKLLLCSVPKVLAVHSSGGGGGGEENYSVVVVGVQAG